MAPPPLSRRHLLNFAKETAGVGVSGNRGMIFTPPGAAAGCDPVSGMAPAQAPKGLDINDASLVRLLYPPKVLKLASSRDFNANDYRTALPAGVGSFVDVVTFQVPKDQVGWLQQFSLYTLNQTAATYASWAILLNGAPVSGFDDVRNPPGIANIVELFTNAMAVRIGMGQKVTLRVTNIDGSAATIGGKIAGWYHPKVAEDRAWGIDP
jgi:hypothetical protein